jgi:hypothetical protein
MWTRASSPVRRPSHDSPRVRKIEVQETGARAERSRLHPFKMIKLSETAERIAATTKKLGKIAIVAEYLKGHTPEEASVSAVFLSGRPFPVSEETTLQVGGRVLWRIVAELSGKSEADLTAAYRKFGDLGGVAEAVLSASPGQARQFRAKCVRSRRQVP